MTSNRKIGRGYTAFAGILAAAAVSVAAAVLVEWPPEYAPFVFPAVFAVTAVAFPVILMRRNKTFWGM